MSKRQLAKEAFMAGWYERGSIGIGGDYVRNGQDEFDTWYAKRQYDDLVKTKVSLDAVMSETQRNMDKEYKELVKKINSHDHS